MVEKNWLEWTVFSTSLLVLAFIFAFLGYDALTSENERPDLTIELGAPEEHDGYFVVPVNFKNDGGQSVEDVQVDVTLVDEGQEVETSSVTAPVVPRESERRAWVVFSTDPASADRLETRIVSFVEP